MLVALVEPYFSGSHKSWALELQKHSSHDIHLFTLPGRNWKWRMHGAAVTLASKINESDVPFDLIVATDMMDLALFKSLLSPKHQSLPLFLYFHENQLTYPWPEDDPDAEEERLGHYQFINYTSALVADRIFFNSLYHKNSFISALPGFLKTFPDHRNLESVNEIEVKSDVLSVGVDLKRFDKYEPEEDIINDPPIILWNHRWEYDKNPEAFFRTLFELKSLGVNFQLVVLGAHFRKCPKIFDEAKTRLQEEILHWGYCDSFDEYARWLWKSDILPVTSIQDFFGISIVEAIYCGCIPLLPNRLAYPEHVNNDKLFYKTHEELLRLLVSTIDNRTKIDKPPLKRSINRYDWHTVIEKYDQKWTELAVSKR
jgi:glycosyltransferase involved in cell wall biosynthesis